MQALNRELDRDFIRPKVQAFNEPSFGIGDAGTLHGKRADANGYAFLRIILFGTVNVKIFKGCTVIFTNTTTKKNIEIASDTQEIESYFSESLGKGMTEFEIYLKAEQFEQLRQQSHDSLTINFGKTGIFKREKYTFEVDTTQFSALLQK